MKLGVSMGPLLRAAGQCMHDQLKMFHSLLSPPAHPVWKCNGRIATTMINKRKASNDNLMLQPPLKKLAHDGMVGALPMNTMQRNSKRDWHSESVGEVECAI